MDNSDFLNLYIEKILNNLTDRDRKLLLLESQFEFNQKAWEVNSKELEDKTKEVERLNKELSDIRISCDEAHKLWLDKEEEIIDLKSRYDKLLEEKEVEIRELIKSKDNDLHPLTLQIESLKSELNSFKNPVKLTKQKEKIKSND